MPCLKKKKINFSPMTGARKFPHLENAPVLNQTRKKGVMKTKKKTELRKEFPLV